jgi:hypothetical protein
MRGCAGGIRALRDWTAAQMAEFALEDVPTGSRSAIKRQPNLGQYVNLGTDGKTILNEQHANVSENKGSALHSPRQSWNVTENASSYKPKVGMLLKRKDVGGKRAGCRIQDSGLRSPWALSR